MLVSLVPKLRLGNPAFGSSSFHESAVDPGPTTRGRA